jgi:serine phosphatase RsbU (regulator of sigma subunit)
MVSLAHRPAGSATWNALTESPIDSSIAGLTTDTVATSYTLSNDGRTLTGIQQLPDRSTIAISLDFVDHNHRFTEQDLVFVRLLAQLFENAYQMLIARRTEKELIFSLNHKILQLNSLIDTGIDIARLSGGTPPHHLALERAGSLTNASKGLVQVSRSHGSTETHYFPAGLAFTPSEEQGFHISSSFTHQKETFSFHLFDKESRAGRVAFDENDQLLLDALVRQVHASLENRYLHQQSLEKQRIEQDMAVAASIQQRIIPKTLPPMQGYDIAGINVPSKSVGGDYYDCIPLPDGRYALVIADVAGKGVPAALLVSSLHAYLAAYLESPFTLVDLAQKLNRAVRGAATEDKFITAFIAILEPATGRVESLNAGHTPVYHLRVDGTLEELNLGGIPFGMLEMDFPYEVGTTTINPGDRLFLYTDGIPEAFNAEGDAYDSVRPLNAVMKEVVPETAEAFISEIVADLKSFIGTAPQSDDITALYLIRKP